MPAIVNGEVVVDGEVTAKHFVSGLEVQSSVRLFGYLFAQEWRMTFTEISV